MKSHRLIALAALLLAGCNGSNDDEPASVRVVQATPNAFTGFSTDDFTSLVDLRFGDTDHLYAAEIDGQVYVLDVDAAGNISQNRTFAVTTGGLAPSQSVTQLTILSDHAAYLTAPAFSSPPNDAVFLFDPATATAATVAKLQIGDQFVVLGGTRQTSAGGAAGAFAPNFVHTAARIGNKLFVTMSNSATFPDFNPGTVLVYDLAPGDPLDVVSSGAPQNVSPTAGGAVMPRNAIFTSAFNPQNAGVYTDESGRDLLVVVNSGVSDFFATVFFDGSIDVIDPATESLVATYPLAGQSPVGLAIAARRRLAVTGSQLFPSMAAVDLRGLDALTGNLAGQVIDSDLAVPRVTTGTSNFLADLAWSDGEDFAYVVNFNDSAVSAVDFQTRAAPRVAGQFTVPGRHPAPFASVTNFIEVRPGRPGADYTGPDIFTAAINLVDQDETPANTGSNCSIDTFQTTPR